jgi:GNAT superfamily N-acetyltransferase
MNPIERLFSSLLQAVFGVVAALFRGVLTAPATAAARIVGPVDVERAPAAALIDLRHRVLRAGRPRETAFFDGDNEIDARHWVARIGDDVVGVATVLRRPWPAGEGPTWQLRGMAVDPTQQGRGIGAALLSTLVTEVGEALWCNARTTAAGFYERNGWSRRGDTFEIPEVGPHVRMVYGDPRGAIDVER